MLPPGSLPQGYSPPLPTSSPPAYPTQPGAYPTQPGAYPTQPGAYPTQPGAYPTQPGAYPTLPGAYPTQPGAYPTQPGAYPTQPGAYPTQPGAYPTQPGAYPTQPGAYPPPGLPPGGAPPSAKPSLSGESRLGDHLLDWLTFSIGFTGGAGVAVLDEPSDQTIKGQEVRPGYPGFVGVDWVVGASFEARLLGYVGVELDLMYAREQGSAEMTVTDLGVGTQSRFYIDIGHGSTHVPLLLKGAIAGKVATPFLLLGPEFVIPRDRADASIRGANPTPVEYGAFTKSYTMLAFGLGLEVNLPTPKVDLRIPFAIRGGYYPGLSRHRDERVEFEPASGPPLTAERYATTWQFTARAQLGLTANF